MKATIRKAVFSDAVQIAQVHIQSWKETYPGIMPERKLASLNLDASIHNWESNLQGNTTFYVAEMDNVICGFICGGENRSNEGCETGMGDKCSAELAAMYIRAKYHKQGIGKALFDAFTTDLISQGHKTMVAWVAEKNPACGFYARMGGKLADRENLLICGEYIPVVAFTYSLSLHDHGDASI